MQRPPMTPSEFEDNVRRSLAVEKLRASLTDWLSVPDKELEQEYRRRNDKVKLAVVSFTADSFRSQVTATDAEVASYFEAHKDDFKIPEKRKIRYLLIDVDALRAKVVVPPADIERAYNDNIEQYTTPEQVRASHILLKTEGKDDAAVKAKAEDAAEAGEGRRRLRRAREEELRGRGEREERRRPRLLRPRPDGAGVRSGGVRDAAGPDQRPGEDAVRLPHHQAGRQEDRARRGRSPKCGSSSPISSPTSARRRRRPTSRRSSRSRSRSRPISTRSAKAQGLTVQESGFFARDEPILGLGAVAGGGEHARST